MPHRSIHGNKCNKKKLSKQSFVLQVSGDSHKPFEVSFLNTENGLETQKNIPISVEKTIALIENTQLVYNEVVYVLLLPSQEECLSIDKYIELALVNVTLSNSLIYPLSEDSVITVESIQNSLKDNEAVILQLPNSTIECVIVTQNNQQNIEKSLLLKQLQSNQKTYTLDDINYNIKPIDLTCCIDSNNHYNNDRVAVSFMRQLYNNNVNSTKDIKTLLKTKPYNQSHSWFYLLTCSYQGQKLLFNLFNNSNLMSEFSVQELDKLFSEKANTPRYAISNYGSLTTLEKFEKQYCDNNNIAYFDVNDALGNLVYGKDVTGVDILATEGEKQRNHGYKLLFKLLENEQIASNSLYLNPVSMQKQHAFETFIYFNKYYRIDDIDALVERFKTISSRHKLTQLPTVITIPKNYGHLTHERVDIFRFPKWSKFNKKLYPGEVISIGDLHANPIKAIYILIDYGIIELSEDNFNQLVTCYINLFDAQNELASLVQAEGKSLLDMTRHIAKQLNDAEKNRVKDACDVVNCLMMEFKTIIGQICSTDLLTKLIFIGDEVGDRGENDLLILWLFDHLNKLNIDFTTMLSNHGITLPDAIQNKKLCSTLINPGQQRSLIMMRLLIACNQALGIKVDDEYWRIGYVTQLYSGAYSESLRIIDYSIDKNTVTLYTHAAIDEQVIQELAIYFKVSYCSNDIKQFTQCLDKINAKFQSQIKTKKFDCNMIPRKCLNGSIERHVIEWLTWYRSSDPRFKRELNRAETLGKAQSQFFLVWVRGHDPKIEVLPHCICTDNLSGKSLTSNHEDLPIYISIDKQLTLENKCHNKADNRSTLQANISHNNNENVIGDRGRENLTKLFK